MLKLNAGKTIFFEFRRLFCMFLSKCAVSKNKYVKHVLSGCLNCKFEEELNEADSILNAATLEE